MTPKRVPAEPEPQVVDARFPSRRAFLSQVTVARDACTFVIPDAAALKAGGAVRVKLRFTDQVVTFDLAGRVQRCESWGDAIIEVSGKDVQGFALAYAFARGLPLELGRRDGERVGVALPAQLRTPTAEQVPCVVQDLSRGGARVVIPAGKLDEGDPVRFAIRLGLLRRLRGVGSVAWAARRPDGLVVGIEFGALDAADRQRLATFLLQRRGMQPGNA